MSNDSIEQSIREVAARHGVALSRDDPILIVQTLNEQLVKNLATAQSEMLEQFRRDLELTCSQWREDAKVKSERILNEALATSRRELLKDIESATATAADTIIKAGTQNSTEIHSVMESSRRFMWIAVSALSALFALIALCGAPLVRWCL